MSAGKRGGDEAEEPGTGPSRAATLLLVGAVLGAAVVLFAWMNTETVPVTVFLWEPEISKAILMFGPLAAGFVLGWGLRASRARSRDGKDGGRRTRDGGRGGSGGSREGAADGG